MSLDPAGEGRVGFPQRLRALADPRADGKRSCPSRHPRSRTGRCGGAAGAAAGARRGKSASGSPMAQRRGTLDPVAHRDSGSRRINSGRVRTTGQPPSLPGEMCQPTGVRPRACRPGPTRDPGGRRPPHLGPAAQGMVPCQPSGEVLGRARRVPRPKKGNRRAYSLWSFALPRVPMPQPAPRATSPSASRTGSAGRRIAVTAAAAACQAPPPRVFLSGPPTRRSPSWASPTAAHCSINFV